MKQNMKTMILAAAACLVSITLSAQDSTRRSSREDLAVRQAEHISIALALGDDVSDKFKKTYCDFQKEMWALGPSLGKQNPDSSSEDEMKRRFERSQKILDLRKKYYEIYSTFLTQKQIARVYEIERDMMRRLSASGKSGNKAGGIGGGRGGNGRGSGYHKGGSRSGGKGYSK